MLQFYQPQPDRREAPVIHKTKQTKNTNGRSVIFLTFLTFLLNLRKAKIR